MVSEPTDFTVDATTRNTADVSWTDNSTDEEGHRIYFFEDRYKTNFLEEDMGSWAHWFEGGHFSRTQEVWHRDRNSGKKSRYNDPSGGYVLLDSTTGRPFRLFCSLYRATFDGGNYERLGVVDSNGDGYDFRFARGNDSVGIGVRNGHDPNTLTTTSVSVTRDVWYYLELVVFSQNIYANVYDTNMNRLAHVETTDTTHTGPFDRVHVYGGYPYYVDELRVEEAVQTEEVAADTTSATVSPLKDGRWKSLYVEAFNDTNNDYAHSQTDMGMTGHGSLDDVYRASVIPDRHEVIPGWDAGFNTEDGGGFLAEAYYEGNLIGRSIERDPTADHTVVDVDTDGRWYNVEVTRWTVDSYGPSLSTNISTPLPDTLCRADFESDGAVHVKPIKQDDNPKGTITIVRGGVDLVELPDPEQEYVDDEVNLHDTYTYRIRRFTEEEPT